MRQPINFICTPECNINVVDQDVDVQLSPDGARQALAIGERLLSYFGEVSLFTSSEAGALFGTKVIAEVAKIGGHSIGSDLSKKSPTCDFEEDGEAQVIGMDGVELTSYTELDMNRMLRFYRMVSSYPLDIPAYAVTDKGSIMALLGALEINNNGAEIQPGSSTSIVSAPEVSTIVAVTTLSEVPDKHQGSQDSLAA